MHIQEVIVVEGKNDTINIQKAVDAYTIETHGTHLSNQTLKLIEKAQKTRGVIIFTDPDSPGDQIRNKINQRIDGCKNAFLPSKIARGRGKVGIEHAKSSDILEALAHCVTFEKEKKESLTWNEFLALGLSGKKESSALREVVTHYFHLGEANAKTCLKRCNMLGITKEEIEKVLRDKYGK